jgi:hypothetical protein
MERERVLDPYRFEPREARSTLYHVVFRVYLEPEAVICARKSRAIVFALQSDARSDRQRFIHERHRTAPVNLA